MTCLSRVECHAKTSWPMERSHPRHEVFDHAVMHIRFQQRQADFAHGSINILLGELTAPA